MCIEYLLYARPCSKHINYINALTFHKNLTTELLWLSHVMDAKTEAQKGEVTCPRSHSVARMGVGEVSKAESRNPDL